MEIIYKNIYEWQKPVLTEKLSYELLRDDPLKCKATYLAVPWSTLIDKLDYGSPADKRSAELEIKKLEELKLHNAFKFMWIPFCLKKKIFCGITRLTYHVRSKKNIYPNLFKGWYY